ncbi:site-specific integrase [Parvibaculum sp.]|uniref:site-specific integrase n=1 Tax=Parvibaculum sp. TaxID=2024848 RepID=UPI00321088EF
MSADLQSILRQYLQQLIDDDLRRYNSAAPGEPIYAKGKPSVHDEMDVVDYDLETISFLQMDLREWIAKREIKHVQQDMDELMAKHGLTEEQRIPLGRGLLQAQLQALDVAKKRLLKHEHIELASLSPFAGPTATTATAAPILVGPLMSEALPAFIEHQMQEEGWTGQTLLQNRMTYRIFQEVCGDRPVSDYKRRDCTAFYDTLKGLPALWSKDTRWKGMGIREIVEQSKGEDINRLAIKTVKRHFSALGKFFDYLKRRGEYEGENPAHEHNFPTNKKGRSNRMRDQWKGEKLSKLFSSPVWTGCVSAGRRTAVGKVIVRDEKFWLPILGLYHGNRLEEFAQLVRSDIRLEGSIWYFDINDEDGKQVKNEQSKRRVPIHPEVLKLGFLVYLNEVTSNPNDQVFPELTPGGADGKLGHNFSKWFTRYRKDIGVYERGLDYHSFRHGVTTKLYEANISPVIVDELTGHEGVGTGQTVYKKEMSLSVLHDAISKVDWPEVDLSRLYITA